MSNIPKIIFGAELEFYCEDFNIADAEKILRDSFLCPITIVKEDGINQYEVIFPPYEDYLKLAYHIIYTPIILNRYYKCNFSPLPFSDQPANGVHISFSFVNEEFLEQSIHYIVGGLLELMPGLFCFYNPENIDYQRFSTKSIHTPTTFSWGYNNRSAAIRVPPKNQNCSVKRVEIRIPSTSSNPFILFYIIILSVKYGIAKKISPPAPVYGISHDEIYNNTKFPKNLEEAINNYSNFSFNK